MNDPFATLPWIDPEKRRSGLYDCIDCKVNTLDIGHYYTVWDDVWLAAMPSSRCGMACVPCLERRLGRELTPGDFAPAPINVNAAMNDELVARRLFGASWREKTEMFRMWVRLYAEDYATGLLGQPRR